MIGLLTAHPPFCRPAFHIGMIADPGCAVTRLDAMRAILAAVADAVRGTVAEADAGIFAPGPPHLRCLIVLAGSTDGLLAEAAAAEGFALQVVLPGPSHGVTPALRAEAVLELDGATDSRLEASRVVLDQSDLIIALDNGTAGIVAQLLAEAEARDQPAITADPSGQRPAILLLPGIPGQFAAFEAPDWRIQLAPLVRAALLPGAAGEETAPALRRYLAETQPVLPWYGGLSAPVERLLLRGWVPPAGHAVAAIPPGPLDQHLLWADELAILYARLHRSFVTLRYLLTLPTALGACIAFYLNVDGAKAVGFGLQAASLTGILQITKLNRKQQWLARFTDDRLLAELLRHQRILGALGRTVPAVSRAPHRPDAAVNWVSWYLRAAVREAGLPNDRMTPARLDALLGLLRGELEEQRDYHRRTAARYDVLEHRLDCIGNRLYMLGLTAVGLRALIWLTFNGRTPPFNTMWLDIASFVLPALAPVFLGLRSQAEYARLAMQSHAMANQLDMVLQALDGPRTPSHAQLSRVAAAASRIMVREASDWRLAVKAKPVSAT